MPLENAVGSRAFSMVSLLLNQASTSVPKYQDSPWGSQYTQANHPLSTPPTIYANEDGGSSIFEGRSIQLPRPTIPVPITQAHTPFHGDHFETPLVNAITPRFEGDMQDRTSDDTAYPRISLSSLNSSILLPHAVGYPSRYPQDNGNASRFIVPPFVHGATAGFTMGLASKAVSRGYTAPLHDWPDHHQNASSWSVFPNPVKLSIPGPYPSGYPDSENFAMPLEWTTNSDRFTGQSYLPPSKPTEIASTPVMPYGPPYTFPTPSQPMPRW
ncbi:hypothetical protein F5141DRAFT_1209678 [Pisolithus sp. B1]|nr:hypothetical protein F5141DRAFT_1209678 [Pisolithus sp. B1]